ncbi:MAG: acyl carrier protein [Candidatus Staskawiczbacteria bacterium]|jgi:acyl carrier protein
MKRIKKVLSKVLGIEESSITEKTSHDNVATWDSFNSLMLVSELENSFNIKLTTQEVVSMGSVEEIKDILEKHGVILGK